MQELSFVRTIKDYLTVEKKGFYYRGLQNYNHERGWLIDTCLDGQDIVKSYLDYFKIKY